MTGRVVAVVGASEASDEECERAEAVGRELARHGALVVCGGLGGVMAAACRGAKAEGGATLGILPGTDRRVANAWVDVAVPTGMGEGRNILVVRAADAVVAIGGEYGTLSEIAFALKIGTPVVGMATWALDPIVRVDDPGTAARTALTLATEHMEGEHK
ncbi:MAG: TIGR00725 family protein [Acidimicrobiales bacterium]